MTVKISFFALLLDTALGAVICLLRTRKNPVVRGIAYVYIAICHCLMMEPKVLRFDEPTSALAISALTSPSAAST